MSLLCSLFGHDFGLLYHPYSAVYGGAEYIAEVRATCARCDHFSKSLYDKGLQRQKEINNEMHEVCEKIETETSTTETKSEKRIEKMNRDKCGIVLDTSKLPWPKDYREKMVVLTCQKQCIKTTENSI